MRTEAEFQKFFQTELLGDLYELENQRLKIVGKVRILLFFICILFLGCMFFLFWFQPQRTGKKPEFDPITIFWIILCLIILIGSFVLVTSNFSRKFKTGFKERVIRRIIGRIGKDITYSPGDKIDINEFRDSRIFKMHDIAMTGYLGRDLISSKVGDISYRFSWLMVTKKDYRTNTSFSSKGVRSSSSHSSSTPVFTGIFFVADFGTGFPADFLVWPSVAKKTKLGELADYFQDKSLGNRIHMEDPAFEQEYAIYGEDETIIRKMMTPGLMRWILDLKVKTGSKVYLSFTGSKMNIAVSLRKNLFEARIFKKVTDYNFILENFQYLVLFNGLLEDLGRKH